MIEPARHHIDAYVGLDTLIDVLCRAVSKMWPYEVGEWYAERLEAAAKEIRETNKEAQS